MKALEFFDAIGKLGSALLSLGFLVIVLAFTMPFWPPWLLSALDGIGRAVHAMFSWL
ncbi:MAG TPA: hypothetical protein VIW73_13515 [Candidatus Cybelea sp.]